MTEYYFDIETYSPGERPNPDKDKIISIQFQRINLATGKPIGDLVILKEWESSEKEIVAELFDRFFHEGSQIWEFIPVGHNLNFEWEFLKTKFEKYLGKKFSSRDLHYSRPYLDIKPILVLLNDGQFVGAKLDNFTKKSHDGRVIKEFYENKEFKKIEKYIKEEAEAFLEFLQRIDANIRKLVS